MTTCGPNGAAFKLLFSGGSPRPPASGTSLKAVAVRFDVDTRTLAREFRRAGIETRSRRGWLPGVLDQGSSGFAT